MSQSPEYIHSELPTIQLSQQLLMSKVRLNGLIKDVV